MNNFLIASSIASLGLGFFLRRYERRHYGKVEQNPKRLTALQVAYSVLLAYPFCALYAWVDLHYFR